MTPEALAAVDALVNAARMQPGVAVRSTGRQPPS